MPKRDAKLSPAAGDLFRKGKVFRLLVAEPIEFNNYWLVAEAPTEEAVRVRGSGRHMRQLTTGHLKRWLTLATLISEGNEII